MIMIDNYRLHSRKYVTGGAANRFRFKIRDDAPRIRAVIVEGELDDATIAALRDAMDRPELRVVYALPTVAEIAGRVCFETGVTPAAITGNGQPRNVSRARKAISWVAHYFGNRTYAQIAAALGDRDYKTIRWQVDQAEKLRQRDPAFLALTDKVVRHFNDGGLA